MVGLRWLKLDRTGLKEAPEELGKLKKLVSKSQPIGSLKLKETCRFPSF